MLTQCARARLLRDYLGMEFQGCRPPFGFDLERIVDDFVLFCMLIGNDFLPGAPLPWRASVILLLPAGTYTHPHACNCSQ